MTLRTVGAGICTIIVALVLAVLAWSFIDQNNKVSSLQQNIAGLQQQLTDSSSSMPPAASGQPTTDNSQQNPTQTVTINVNGTCVTCANNGSSCNATSSQSPDSSPAPSDQPSAAPSSAPQGCPKGVRHDHVLNGTNNNTLWRPTEPGGIVMRTWSNHTDPNWPASGMETLVLYGTDPSARPNAYIGGSYWVWPSLDCAIADIATQTELFTEGGKKVVYNLTGQDITVPDGWTVKTSLPDNLVK